MHGYYSGSARADVDATEVSIRGTLAAEDGSTARLEIRDVVVEGPYFAGNGTLGSKSVRITGRLDAAMSSRLSAVFRVSDGHVGRIVGTLPTDPGDPDWLLPSN